VTLKIQHAVGPRMNIAILTG